MNILFFLSVLFEHRIKQGIHAVRLIQTKDILSMFCMVFLFLVLT